MHTTTKRVLYSLSSRGLLNWMPDWMYLKIMYYARLDKRLNLANPHTFNEKLQWIKLYDRRPVYTMMVDKYEVKKYVSSLIGEKYIIPTYGVWKSFDEIDFGQLPNQFVLKCTHDSGGLIICRDKEQLSICDTKKKINDCMKKNFYWHGREWPYKDVNPRIIAEKYMVDESGNDLKDYKVMCFNGVPRLIELHKGRFTDHQTQDFYDTNWNKTTISQNGTSTYQVSSDTVPCPNTLDEMLSLSAVLSKGIPHVRVDWYSIVDRLYFGELTFFDGSGFDPYDDPNDDELLGSWITLPNRK